MSSPEAKTKDLPVDGTGHVLDHTYGEHQHGGDAGVGEPKPEQSAPGSFDGDKASFVTDDQDEGITRIEALCE